MPNFRKYGRPPFTVAVLHGGPGAPGEMAPVARGLTALCGVLEPLQTARSVDGQVQELYAVLHEHVALPVILIGWSWGALLGFIFAAEHPRDVSKLILISSPPFEEKYAAQIMPTRLSRLGEVDRAEAISLMKRLEDPTVKDADKILARFGRVISKADSYDPLPHDDEMLEFQSDVYKAVWKEAAEMRSSGRLLELGKKISCPVVAIHGDFDPHPYRGVEEPLSQTIKNFRFILLENCGHQPWYEKKARDRFFAILKPEITALPHPPSSI